MQSELYTCAWCREPQHYPWSVTVYGRECCSYECANKVSDALTALAEQA